MTKGTVCPICKSQDTGSLITRKDVPVHQNLILGSKDLAGTVTRGDLELKVCNDCSFIFNDGFDSQKLRYGEDYDNTQSFSPSFDNYLSGLVEFLINEEKVVNCRIVEVGCGKGLFLKRLVSDVKNGNVGYGFDPSYVGPESDFDGRLHFFKNYYDESCSDIPADVVVCRHVIEHISRPHELLKAINKALKNSLDARIYMETPCVEWILGNNVIWDFFYEHCSYFSANSLALAFELSGFKVEYVKNIFGGQYMWLKATVNSDQARIKKVNMQFKNLIRLYKESEIRIIKILREEIERLTLRGKVALWGAGAKGATLANLIDPDCKLIDSIIDLNPNKQGCYIPGSGHRIIEYNDIKNRNITSAIVMNPNYTGEIAGLLREKHINISLIEMELNKL